MEVTARYGRNLGSDAGDLVFFSPVAAFGFLFDRVRVSLLSSDRHGLHLGNGNHSYLQGSW